MSTTPASRPPEHRRPALMLRDADAGRHFELFFIAAVVTVLLIRAFLALTGYPQLGHGRIHVAHMLWGGLAMAAALLFALLSLSRRARPIAALVGGAGFGLFIDELGKFLTRDNDYYYQPTIALIYVLFVILFLVVRSTLSARALDPEENMANAIALMKEVALGDLDADEKARALAFLARCSPEDPRVAELRAVFDRLEVVAPPPPSAFARFRHGFRGHLRALTSRSLFPRALSFVLLLQAVVTFVWAALTVRALWALWRMPAPGGHFNPGLMSWGRLAASLAAGAFTAVGAVRLLHSRRRAYRSFRRGLHVTLLLTQFFVFYESQLAGVVSLIFNLVLLAAVQYLLRQEEAKAAARAA